MRWERFTASNAIGGILWAGAYAFGSYAVGSAFSRVSGDLAIVAGVTFVIVFVGIMLVARSKIGKLSEKAQAIYPDPLY
jgi:membrane protein DedA with SNARE-associated domain